MTDDESLVREIESLCAGLEQPGQRNISFVTERLRAMLLAGHGFPDIESALRRRDAPVFLLGRPPTAEMQSQYRLVHPDDAVDADQLRFFLWIGINGQPEVDHVLARESLSAAQNLVNLAATGFLARHEAHELPSDPTFEDLLEWLLGYAPSWTARRAVIGQYLNVLKAGQASRVLHEVTDRLDLDASARLGFAALVELISQASEFGLRLALQNCEPLIHEALDAFLTAPTWMAAGEVYQRYEDELSGDLARDILGRTAGASGLTAAQRQVIDAHAQVLDIAWEHEIGDAVRAAEQQFPAKHGTPAEEDYLQAYLAAPNLESARNRLLAAPEALFQLDHQEVVEGLRRARTSAEDDIWRIGLLEDARDRGIDAAFRDWAELRAIEDSADDEKAVGLLTELLDRHQGCLRDRTLEILLNLYIRTGDLQAQRAVAQELTDSRSAASPHSHRPLDLANLAITCARQGQLEAARAAFAEALALSARLVDPAWRGLIWLQAGTFYRSHFNDLAMAVHCYRVAVEEFRAAADPVSAGRAFEGLSSVYRSLHRARLAQVYSFLAQRSIGPPDGGRRGAARAFSDVAYEVRKGVAETQYLLGDFGEAASNLRRLLTDSSRRMTDDDQFGLERVALASTIGSGDSHGAEAIATSWSAAGRDDWAAFGRAAVAIGRSLASDGGRPAEPAQIPELAGLGGTLTRLGFTGVDDFLRAWSHPGFGWALIDTLAGVSQGSPFIASRLMGDHEAAAWATRSQRAQAAARPATAECPAVPALPPGAPWPEIIARYAELGVWELPDLAVLGPILDRWSVLSRFGDAVRINQPVPGEGFLDVYFFSSDPEGHLGRAVSGCAYIPDGELVICSLPYLDDLFGASNISWDEQAEKIMVGLRAAGLDDADIATSLAAKGRAREQILLEWVIAHEIGHAHFGHAAAFSSAIALAFEEQADSFFLDGVLADDGLVEILLAMFGQLNRLYEYDCQNQFHRAPTPVEVTSRSLLLDATPDASGHRPLVFRAVALVRSILRMRPDLEDSSFIDKYAASLEGR